LSKAAGLSGTLAGPGSFLAIDSDNKVVLATPSGGGSSSPAGSDTQIQFNQNGSFAGSSGLTYDGSGSLSIDKDYTDTTANPNIVGIDIDFDKTGASTTNNTMYGLKVDMDNTTATDGANTMYGVHVTPTLTHAADAGVPVVYGALINAQGGTNGTCLVQGARIEAGGGDLNYGLQLDVEDGGVDLRIESSADNGDYFQIQTTTAGATTFTTVDDGGAAAHLTCSIDGDILLDPVGETVVVDGDIGVRNASPKIALDVHYTGSGNPTGLGNDTGGGHVAYFGTSSANLTAGGVYYLNKNGGWESVDSATTGSGHNQLLGISLGTNPLRNGILLNGYFDVTSFYSGSFIKGAPVYIQSSSVTRPVVGGGYLSSSAPTAADSYVRVVGYGTDTANVIYFNPDSTYVEIGS
jgi:hypothetical protein